MMLDTSRVYLTKRVIDHSTSPNFRDILNIINALVSMIIFPAAFCSFVETIDSYPYFNDINTFFEMVFFVFVSSTFVGYGSQVFTEIGKIFLTFFLLTCFIIVPSQASKLMSLFAAKSPWARARFEKIGKDIPHLVIMGQISPSNLKNFLNEFFHPDHEGDKKQCVVIQKCRPSKDILDLIKDP